jgi:hypothetical protein
MRRQHGRFTIRRTALRAVSLSRVVQGHLRKTGARKCPAGGDSLVPTGYCHQTQRGWR